ncbi:hypothetical protein I3760_16G076000 [Carya illinoinensis]|nr:hypothetical protein I3760_16G076000 [Carya illinoinensis]
MIRKAPAIGSKEGCIKEKGGPEDSRRHYRGVRQRKCGKWVAEIRQPNNGYKRLWLGAFANAVEAAFAYDEAAKAMHGSCACLNFPAGCLVTTSSGTCAEATPSGSDSSTTFNHSGVCAAEEIDVKPLIPNLLPMVVQIRKAPAIGSKEGCIKGKGGPENSRHHYRGVRQRKCGKWVAEIRQPNNGYKRLWLGAFANAVEAAFAYDEAAKAMHGSSACLNFPAGYLVTTSSGTCAEATPSGSDSPTTFNHSGVCAAEEIDVKPLIPNLLPMVVQIRKAPAIGSKEGCIKGKGGPENSIRHYRGV